MRNYLTLINYFIFHLRHLNLPIFHFILRESIFDPNLQQALAWKRLEIGTHTQDDVTWIKHECAKRHHELKYGSGYNEAHNRAQTRFDGAPWENQF